MCKVLAYDCNDQCYKNHFTKNYISNTHQIPTKFNLSSPLKFLNNHLYKLNSIYIMTEYRNRIIAPNAYPFESIWKSNALIKMVDKTNECN